MVVNPSDILNFWFYEIGAERWFKADPALDDLLRQKYGELYIAAVTDQLKPWEETPEGMLALLLLLDSFGMRMFAGTPQAFAENDRAIDLARHAIIHHFDDRIDRNYKLFFYLPFQHSESEGNQRLAEFYIRERTKEPSWIDAVEDSLATIMRFGRFPERNAILERASTAEELAYLQLAK